MKFIPEPIADEHRTPYPRIDLYGPKPAEGGVSEIEPYVTTAVADQIWDAVVHTARGTNVEGGTWSPPIAPESVDEESSTWSAVGDTVYWVNSDGALVNSDEDRWEFA